MLAAHCADGWKAVPVADQHEQFHWSANRHPYYFTMVTPAANPFPGERNAIELLAIYYCCQHLTRAGRPVFITDIAKRTGISRKAVGVGVKTLTRRGYLDADKHTLAQTWENAIYSPDYEDAKPMKAKTENIPTHGENLVNTLIGGTKHESEILRTMAKLKGRVPLAEVAKDIERALAAHKANRAAGDGSALVLSWLQKRLDGMDREQAYRDAKRNAAQQHEDARRERQIRESIMARIVPEEHERAEELFAFAIGQLEEADLALCGLGRRLTVAEMLSVIADPSKAKTMKTAPVKPPVNTPVAQVDDLLDDDLLHSMDDKEPAGVLGQQDEWWE